MANTGGGTGSAPLPIAPLMVVRSGFALVRYGPVSTRIVGGGTSAVVPGGAARGWLLPEGAVLVSDGLAGPPTSAVPPGGVPIPA